MTSRLRSRGFTLVEMIMVIVILGVISSVIAVFMVSPVKGYFDAVRRAELVDTADTALRRIGRDVRRAVPNSVRVNAACAAASCYLEFLPTTNGGRYRAAGQQQVLGSLCPTGGSFPHNTFPDTLFFSPEIDTCFEILGPQIAFTVGDQIIIGNWGHSGSDAYEGVDGATFVRRAIPATAAASSKVVMTSTSSLPLESPSKRFQVVAAAEPAVTYACEGVNTVAGDGTGTLTRYRGYVITAAQVTPPGGSSALIASNVSSCNIVYDTPSARNGVVAIVLGITRSGETINLYHEIHVDILP
jgi:MSHA biogenesis protein MshO